MPEDVEFVPIAHAAELTGTKPDTIYRAAHRGVIAVKRLANEERPVGQRTRVLVGVRGSTLVRAA